MSLKPSDLFIEDLKMLIDVLLFRPDIPGVKPDIKAGIFCWILFPGVIIYMTLLYLGDKFYSFMDL